MARNSNPCVSPPRGSLSLHLIISSVFRLWAKKNRKVMLEIVFLAYACEHFSRVIPPDCPREKESIVGKKTSQAWRRRIYRPSRTRALFFCNVNVCLYIYIRTFRNRLVILAADPIEEMLVS